MQTLLAVGELGGLDLDLILLHSRDDLVQIELTDVGVVGVLGIRKERFEIFIVNFALHAVEHCMNGDLDEGLPKVSHSLFDDLDDGVVFILVLSVQFLQLQLFEGSRYESHVGELQI